MNRLISLILRMVLGATDRDAPRDPATRARLRTSQRQLGLLLRLMRQFLGR